jgi:hypothetical protein
MSDEEKLLINMKLHFFEIKYNNLFKITRFFEYLKFTLFWDTLHKNDKIFLLRLLLLIQMRNSKCVYDFIFDEEYEIKLHGG